MSDQVELARHEWDEGYRRLESERGMERRYRRLVDQVEVVVDELRKRVGGKYTLAELAAAYTDADRWARAAVEDRAPSPGWPRDLALVLAAAFHAYQRGATDYAS
jgi:alcohol dehydrogenase class IV